MQPAQEVATPRATPEQGEAAVTEQAALLAENAELREEVTDVKAALADTLANNEMMGRVFDADDQVKAAMAEATRHKALMENAERMLSARSQEFNERSCWRPDMELEYAPNSGLSRITPRPFQVSAREALRNGFVEGHRCQMVMSPTGSGKTILAMFLINEALMRGKRAIFVADRRTLIDQTSYVADTLGLSHGVLMADSPRYEPDNAFQIASAQTLAQRQWPKADLIIVDEAHTQLSVWTEHIQKCKAAVIGLSAIPFSKGLGRLFTNLGNATTMTDLTESGRAGADARIDSQWSMVVPKTMVLRCRIDQPFLHHVADITAFAGLGPLAGQPKRGSRLLHMARGPHLVRTQDGIEISLLFDEGS